MSGEIGIIGPLNIDIILTGEIEKDFSHISELVAEVDIQIAAAGSIGYTVQDLALLSADLKVCSCIADDGFGTFLLNNLKNIGVETDLIDVKKNTTSAVAVYVLMFGSRKRPFFFQLPTHIPWPLEFALDVKKQLLSVEILHSGGYLHFENMYHSGIIELFEEAVSRGVITSLDPQFPLHHLDEPWIEELNDLLPNIRYLFCDEHEAVSITGKSSLSESAQFLLDSGPDVVILKQGADGSDIYTQRASFHQKAVKKGELVDSVGAGDAYDAGFLYGLFKGWELEQCARFSATIAGHTVTQAGGTRGMPGKQSLEKIVKEIIGG